VVAELAAAVAVLNYACALLLGLEALLCCIHDQSLADAAGAHALAAAPPVAVAPPLPAAAAAAAVFPLAPSHASAPLLALQALWQ